MRSPLDISEPKARTVYRSMDEKQLIPIGEILSRAKVSCSGSFLRISAAIGSGWTPDKLWDRIMLEAGTGAWSPFALMCCGKTSFIS